MNEHDDDPDFVTRPGRWIRTCAPYKNGVLELLVRSVGTFTVVERREGPLPLPTVAEWSDR